jgi:hypothetical protein
LEYLKEPDDWNPAWGRFCLQNKRWDNEKSMEIYHRFGQIFGLGDRLKKEFMPHRYDDEVSAMSDCLLFYDQIWDCTHPLVA